MVKGVCRQIILVESPDPALFERAIFILREGAEGPGSRELLRQARRIAERSLEETGEAEVPVRVPGGGGLLWLAAGAALMGLVWLLASVI